MTLRSLTHKLVVKISSVQFKRLNMCVPDRCHSDDFFLSFQNKCVETSTVHPTEIGSAQEGKVKHGEKLHTRCTLKAKT